jgi:hypothetical protein
MRGPNQLGQIGRGACAVSCTGVALAGGHLLRGTDRCWPLVALVHGTAASRWPVDTQLAGIRIGTDVAAQECH